MASAAGCTASIERPERRQPRNSAFSKVDVARSLAASIRPQLSLPSAHLHPEI
jgi:hypothetical protein